MERGRFTGESGRAAGGGSHAEDALRCAVDGDHVLGCDVRRWMAQHVFLDRFRDHDLGLVLVVSG
jgi:hypothetical protein